MPVFWYSKHFIPVPATDKEWSACGQEAGRWSIEGNKEAEEQKWKEKKGGGGNIYLLKHLTSDIF